MQYWIQRTSTDDLYGWAVMSSKGIVYNGTKAQCMAYLKRYSPRT